MLFAKKAYVYILISQKLFIQVFCPAFQAPVCQSGSSHRYQCLTYFFRPFRQPYFFEKVEFLFHEYSQYTGVWKYCGLYKMYAQYRFFSIFTIIKTPRTLAALASLGLLIVKTLTNVLLRNISKQRLAITDCTWYDRLKKRRHLVRTGIGGSVHISQ